MILASDYDGTLCFNDQISITDIEAIRRFQKAGNKFGVATGRSVKMIIPELKQYGIICDFYICNNGGIIVDAEGNLLSRKDIAREDAEELINDLFQFNTEMFGLSDGENFGCFRIKESLKCADRFTKDAVDPYKLLHEGLVNSFFMNCYSEEETCEMAEQLNKKYEGRIQIHYNYGVIDVSATNVNKATGVKIIEQLYHDSAYTIGDSYNDLAMIEAFQGFCVDQAKPEIKERASRIFKSVQDCIDWLMNAGKL